MSRKLNQKTKKTLILLLLLTLLISVSGCRTASDMLNPDSYSRDKSEPWEKKDKKNKPMADEL